MRKKRAMVTIDIPENNVRIGVSFSVLNREEGFDDDIRISLSEPAQKNQQRLFQGDEVIDFQKLNCKSALPSGSESRRCSDKSVQLFI